MGEVADKIKQITDLAEAYISDIQVYSDEFKTQMGGVKQEAVTYADAYTQQVQSRTEQFVADLKAIQETEPEVPPVEPATTTDY